MIRTTYHAEYRGYERSFQAIKGSPIRVLPVPEGDDAVGYTADNAAIYVAYRHAIMKDLSETEQRVFRSGVFTHEMMHQLFTDFITHRRLLRSVSTQQEKYILSTIMNILEDPAIEYWASTVVGGTLLTGLQFSIAHIYKQSPPISDSENPFQQLMNAFIQFGDMGLIKGSFTFPEAKKAFAEIAPIFADAIKEPSGKKRLEIAFDIFERTKYLWETMTSEMMEGMSSEMSQRGKQAMNGSGAGQDGDPSASRPESKKDKRRKITIVKVSKEEFDELKKNASGNSTMPENGDVTIYTCDEADKDGDNSAGNSCEPSGSEPSSESSKDAESAESAESVGSAPESEDSTSSVSDGSVNTPPENVDGEDGENENDKNGSSQNSDKNSSKENDEAKNAEQQEAKKNSASGRNNPFVSKSQNGAKISPAVHPNDDYCEEDERIDADEYEISAEDMSRILGEIQREQESYEAEQKEDAKSDYVPENFDISAPTLPKRTCLNYKVTCEDYQIESLTAKYNEILRRYKTGIQTCTNQLRKIIMNSCEEKDHRTSGHVNPYRLNSGRVTSRVFDKRVTPSDKTNCVFMLVVDESGSMSGTKIVAARECAIALTEIFGNLGIKIYVMGFTADTRGYGVVHNHYITWRNKPNDRLKLLNIAARANNCDGYSIRYATQVLKKAKAAHKFMIVLSDGQPAAYSYRDGVIDTKHAIRDAKKVAGVLGVAIGNDDTDVIYGMYENDFVHISNTKDLFPVLAKKIKKIVNGWE